MADVDGRSTEAVRRLFVRRVRARRGELEGKILARIRDLRFDPTGGEDPEYVAGLIAATAAVIDHVLGGIERAAGELPEPVPAAAIEQARRAARLGVRLDTVLRRYVAGFTVLEDLVMEEVEREDRPARGEALREILGGAGTLIERLLLSVTEAYGQEAERADCRDRPLRNRPPRGEDGARGSPTLPTTLANPCARRSRECLLFVAERCREGAFPSNREVALGIGVAHQSQISWLLRILAEEGLLVKRSDGVGKRNSWRLTEHGEEVARALLQNRLAGEPVGVRESHVGVTVNSLGASKPIVSVKS